MFQHGSGTRQILEYPPGSLSIQVVHQPEKEHLLQECTLGSPFDARVYKSKHIILNSGWFCSSFLAIAVLLHFHGKSNETGFNPMEGKIVGMAISVLHHTSSHPPIW